MTPTAAVAKITAGMLDQRIYLQRRASGLDSRGQPNGAWATVASVWARARPLRSRELFAAGQVQNVTDCEFTIRWRSDVDNTWRVQWRGVTYDITGAPIDVDGQQTWLQLLGASGVREGIA